MKNTKKFTEPVLIKAGSNYLKLGLTNQSPRYDCRLITEGNYQSLKKAYDNNAELLNILQDLKTHGSFYCSAIELDMHTKGAIDGEEFEKRIDTLLKKISRNL